MENKATGIELSAESLKQMTILQTNASATQEEKSDHDVKVNRIISMITL